MALNKKHRIDITDRDLDILENIWRWKILPTSFFYKKYFLEACPYAAYKRLKKMEVYDHISFRVIPSLKGGGWTLKKKGFEAIKSRLGDIKNNGILPANPDHDIIVSTILTGEWLNGVPSGYRVISERELQSATEDNWPHWLRAESEHRPDGFWLVPNEGRLNSSVIALEVELTTKGKSRYLETASYYLHENIDYVLWVIPDLREAPKIRNQFVKVYKDHPLNISFIQQNNLLSHGWKAEIQQGQLKGQNLRQLLCLKSVGSRGEVGLIRNELAFSDFNKYARKTVRYKKNRNGPKS